MTARFNPAPGWPVPPEGWTPPAGWAPDPSWPAAPEGWQFWLDDAADAPAADAPAAAPDEQPTAVLPSAPTAPSATEPPPSLPAAAYATPGSLGGAAVAGAAASSDVPATGVAPALVVPASGRGGTGAWIAVAVVILLAVGGFFLWKGLSGDDEPAPGAAPTSTPTSTAPTEAAPTEAAPTTSTDAVVPPTDTSPTDEAPTPGGDADPAFCSAVMEPFMAVGGAILATTTADYVAAAEPALATLRDTAPPAELASAWAEWLAGNDAILEHMRAQDPSAEPFMTLIAFTMPGGGGADLEPGFSTASSDINRYLEGCF